MIAYKDISFHSFFIISKLPLKSLSFKSSKAPNMVNNSIIFPLFTNSYFYYSFKSILKTILINTSHLTA